MKESTKRVIRTSLAVLVFHAPLLTGRVPDGFDVVTAETAHDGLRLLGTAFPDVAIIDVGLKTEGRVALREFAGPGRESDLKVGDEVEVFLDRIENALGEAVLSRDKARREESWGKLEKAFQNNEKVTGVIFNQVKGGFTVDLSGAVAFLPGSQVDIRPVRDVQPLMDLPQPFQILKMDRKRGNIVVSRRAVLESVPESSLRSAAAYGFEGIRITSPAGVLKVISDPDCPVSRGRVFLNSSHKIRTLGDFVHIGNEDGNYELRLATDDALESRVRSLSNYQQNEPRNHGVFSI